MPPVIAPVVLSQAARNGITYPPAPSNPPTLRDITMGLHLAADVLASHKNNSGRIIEDEDVVQAHIYSSKLISTVELAQPAWMAELVATIREQLADTVRDQITATMQQQMQECLAPIKADLNILKVEQNATRADINALRANIHEIDQNIAQLTNNIAQLTNKVSALQKQQGLTQRLAAILFNRSQGTALGVRLEVVPFNSGEDPTKAPHNLPPILTRDHLIKMEPRALNSYFRGYCPDIAGRPSIPERQVHIFIAIGANVVMPL